MMKAVVGAMLVDEREKAFEMVIRFLELDGHFLFGISVRVEAVIRV